MMVPEQHEWPETVKPAVDLMVAGCARILEKGGFSRVPTIAVIELALETMVPEVERVISIDVKGVVHLKINGDSLKAGPYDNWILTLSEMLARQGETIGSMDEAFVTGVLFVCGSGSADADTSEAFDAWCETDRTKPPAVTAWQFLEMVIHLAKGWAPAEITGQEHLDLGQALSLLEAR